MILLQYFIFRILLLVDGADNSELRGPVVGKEKRANPDFNFNQGFIFFW